MDQLRELATKEEPLINRLRKNNQSYQSEVTRSIEDDKPITIDVGNRLHERTHMSPQKFSEVYQSTMRFFFEQEKFAFKQYQMGERDPLEFERDASMYLKKYFPDEMSKEHDFNVMLKRIKLSMFGYDVIQPLIDDDNTSDIKICGPYDIRVRIKGKAYKSTTTFFSGRDLSRFIEGLGYRNHVDIYSNPIVIFTDSHDENYILRFCISSPVVNSADYPYLHIRKIPKVKPDFNELINRGMLNEDVKQYLIDRASVSKGMVFAGPPGSGKSTALNAWIEYIPKTRETLVIQESDELHTEQSGFMFKHVTHGFRGEKEITLEDLAKMALVEGCNEFIIGEVKGSEMRYAMTLLNAGGYAALTVHSTSASETLNKLADLVKYGSDYSYDEARRMLKTFDTIVYMEGYKIREILEVKDYDDVTKQYVYDYIYRYDPKFDQ